MWASHYSYIVPLIFDAISEPQSTRGRISRYAPLLIWMALIFFASTDEFSAANTSRFLRPLLLWLFPQISEERIAMLHFLVRKLAHFSGYTILGVLAVRAFVGSSSRVLREHWMLSSGLLIIIYALLDEYHQSFVSSRTASIFDSLIDIAGGLFAVSCLAYLKRRRLTRAIHPQ